MPVLDERITVNPDQCGGRPRGRCPASPMTGSVLSLVVHHASQPDPPAIDPRADWKRWAAEKP